VRGARGHTSHLVGRVGDRLVALALAGVEQVLPRMRVEPCPGGPAALVGFANIAGQPVAILAVRTLFGLAPPDPATLAEHRVVLCRRGERTLGLLLDEVLALDAPTALRSPSVEDRIVAVEVVREVGVIGGRVCVVLDPAVAIDWLTRVIDAPTEVGTWQGQPAPPTPAIPTVRPAKEAS
jgi:chemotaxis signal transduction protein